MRRRPYIKEEWVEYVLQSPLRKQIQTNGRIRHWAYIEELNKYLRVVTETDGETVHNAFPDRGFKPQVPSNENMIFQYHPDTDMLYIQLASGVSTESEEVAQGIVLDFDEQNQVIGIEIEDASKFIDLSRLEVSALPIVNLILNQGERINA